MAMEVVYPRCCGLDIHKKSVMACRIIPGIGNRLQREVRAFSTMTEDLPRLSDWLLAGEVSHVAMESTGVYWKPIFNLLENSFHLLLVNAQHIKAVPGRKHPPVGTRVRDRAWIADLLRHGLLKASFVPEREQRELRELTRYRSALVHERTAEVGSRAPRGYRLQKTLEGGNIKLAAVAADVTGVSGRQMLEELVGGSVDAHALAELAKGKLREKLPALEQALTGRVHVHQQFLIARQLAHIDFLDGAIEQVSVEVRERMRPFEEAIVRLDAIPGVGRRTAEVVLAEIGRQMGRFPTAGHLASWAGMCPGNHESAGKRTTGTTRKGSPWLRAALIEAAHAAGRTKNCYLAAQYHRLAARRGKKKAAIAVGCSILVIVSHLLSTTASYHDLGRVPLGCSLDQRDRQNVERRLVRRLEALGCKVTVEYPASTPPAGEPTSSAA